ncbi:ubiquitin-specific protease doa4 [Ceratobasidium sp. 423]|nr:ubiquitin-specific protease doa4 [Ceratobasidium sp. 423]
MELQESLVFSSKTERTLFEGRNTFDLVVLTDTSSTKFGDPATPLDLLFRVIYETEFLKLLRRPPVFLHGGIKAWGDEVGEFKGKDVLVPPSVVAWKKPSRNLVPGRLNAGSASHTSAFFTYSCSWRMACPWGSQGSSQGSNSWSPL